MWIGEKVFRFLALFFVLAFSCFGQGVRKDDIAISSVGSFLTGVPNAPVRVCVDGALGIPCSPTVPIFSNSSLTNPLPNPFTADGEGNYFFYVLPGTYQIQVTTPNGVYTQNDQTLPNLPSTVTTTFNFTSVPFSATPVFSFVPNMMFKMTLTGNVTSSTLTGTPAAGNAVVFSICEDGIGGRTFSFPPGFSLQPGFTLNTFPLVCNNLFFTYDGTVWQQVGGGSGISGIVLPSQGGTGIGTPTAHGVAIGEGLSAPFNFITPSNNGQCFMSAVLNFSTTDPSFQTCPTGGGGTSVGPLGTAQEAGLSAGSFAAMPEVDVGGAGTLLAYSADLQWGKGPNPWVDMRAYARQVDKTSTMITSGGVTATCTSGLATVSLSIASDFVNGDGVNILHCGAANSGVTPSAPTVTPSGVALGMGTRIDKPSTGATVGSTTYTYRAVGITRGRGTSLPSAVTVITNGAASLGQQIVTNTSFSLSGNIATVTTSTPHTLSPGYEINIAGTADANGNGLDGTFGGEYSVNTVPDTTHYTYIVRQNVLNGAVVSAVGGTTIWFNDNHISMTASGGYDYYAIYDSTANRIVCITEPVNSVLIGDQSYLACDDYGTTISGNFFVPEYLSSTVPSSATNDSLTTTIISGAGTTSLVLNASAGASTTGTIHYTGGPNYIAAANAANAIGAPLYFSITSGNKIWFNDDYITWPFGTKILQAGTVVQGDTWNITSLGYWRGQDGAPCVRPAFALVCAPEVLVQAAYPGTYGVGISGDSLTKLTFATGLTNNQSPLVLLDYVSDDSPRDLNFAGSGSNSEYLMMGLEIRGHFSNGATPFVNSFTNLSFSGGPGQVNSSTSTPHFYCNTCGNSVFDKVSVGRRGLLFRPPSAGTQITIHFMYNQGGINPLIRLGFPDSGFANVGLNIDNNEQDTSAMPVVSSLLNTNAAVTITNSNGPSFVTGGVPPLATGSIFYLNEIAAGGRGLTSGANTNNCSNNILWDTVFNLFFSVTTEGVCVLSTQTNITPGYTLYASDINVTAPVCSVASAGPPFSPAGTWTFQSAAVWFNGGLGTISPTSGSCTSNGTSQQITVTVPVVPSGSKGWAVFANGNPVGTSFPSTVTTSYLFTQASGGGAPLVASSGPAGMQNSAGFPGAVWGNFYPNAPNNTPNALPSYDVNGKLIATPCVPLTAGDLCYWNGSSWTRFTGNNSGTQVFQENSSGVPSWGTPAGGGNVSTSGSPVANELACWVSGTAITGTAADSTTTHALFATASGCPVFRAIATGDLPTIPNSGLVNSFTTVNSQTCTLGSSCTIGFANIAAGVLANGTTATTQSVGDNTTQVATDAFVLANTITNPMTTVGDMIAGGTSGTPTRVPFGKTGQILVAINGSIPVFSSPGIADGNGGAAVTSTPYPIKCDSSTSILDRTTSLRFQSGASVVTAPDHTASGCGGNMVFLLLDDGAGTLTVNRGGTDTFSIFDGSTNTDGATSFQLTNGQYATINNGAGGIWEVRKVSTSGGTGLPCNITNLSLQYDNSGAFGCVPDFTFTSPHTLTMGASGILNLSAGGSASFIIPLVPGGIASADGVVVYDLTGKITHVRTNGADSDIAATTSTTTTTTQVLFATGVAGIYNPRLITSSDLPLALQNGTTCVTQSSTDSSANCATDSFVQTVVSNAIAAVNPAVAVQAATVGSSDLSGYTYSNGVSGIGATLTAGSNNTALTVDGFTFTILGQRLLVKNQSSAFQNGIYNVTQLQAVALPVILTRVLDYDQPSDINNTGAIPVQSGTVNSESSWLLTSTVNTVGTDALTYAAFTPPFGNSVTATNTLTNNIPVIGAGSKTLSAGFTFTPGTVTSGHLACYTSSAVVGNCTGLAGVIGVFATSTTWTASGEVSIVLDTTQNVTFGDNLCASSISFGTAHDNGATACTTGLGIGIVKTTASSVSSATAFVVLR